MMSKHASKPNILLAPGNAADVFLVKIDLKQNQVDYSLCVFRNGKSILNFIDRIDRSAHVEPRNFPLPGLYLPKPDGGEILKHLRTNERSGQTPAVLLTSPDSPKDQLFHERYRILHYLRKSSNLSGFMKLGRIVRNMLAKHTPTDRIPSQKQTFSGAA